MKPDAGCQGWNSPADLHREDVTPAPGLSGRAWEGPGPEGGADNWRGNCIPALLGAGHLIPAATLADGFSISIFTHMKARVEGTAQW